MNRTPIILITVVIAATVIINRWWVPTGTVILRRLHRQRRVVRRFTRLWHPWGDRPLVIVGPADLGEFVADNAYVVLVPGSGNDCPLLSVQALNVSGTPSAVSRVTVGSGRPKTIITGEPFEFTANSVSVRGGTFRLGSTHARWWRLAARTRLARTMTTSEDSSTERQDT